MSEETENKTPAIDVTSLTAEQIQTGIDANLQAMMESFVGRHSMLEKVVDRKVDVLVNAKLKDGRKLHIRIR